MFPLELPRRLKRAVIISMLNFIEFIFAGVLQSSKAIITQFFAVYQTGEGGIRFVQNIPLGITLMKVFWFYAGN